MSHRKLEEAFLQFEDPKQKLDQINPDPYQYDNASPVAVVMVAGAGYMEQVSAKEHLCALLALLRALHWEYYTMHWRVKGVAFYGDHQLFQRLYEELPERFDSLAEKMVYKYGEDVVDSCRQMKMSCAWLEQVESIVDWYARGLKLEELLQDQIKTTYDVLDRTNELSLGIDDYLQALANAHETNMYLLQQPMR
jgi:DNA-binding ferritin-like protein